MENKSSTLGILITVAIALLIGVVLIQIIAERGNAVTTTLRITDELRPILPKNNTAVNVSQVITLAQAPTGWKAEETECYITNFVLRNATAILTADTDYVLTPQAGTFTLLDTAVTDGLIPINTTLASYNYCGDDFMASDWSRTVLNMTPGFFALAILISGAFVIYIILRREGIAL